MPQDVRRDLSFPQSPEEVWHALTDRDTLGKWLMPNDFEPRLGHRFTFRTEPHPESGFDGIVRCEVLELDPPHELVISWESSGVDTRITFRLEREGTGTCLHFEQTGFRADQARAGAEYGWTRMFDTLTKLLARQDAE